MTNEQRMAFLMEMVALIFASKAANTDIRAVRVSPQWGAFLVNGTGTGRFFTGGLRGFDVDLRLGNLTRKLRVLEQNPQKIGKNNVYSQYAVLAQQGHQICWIIDRDKQQDAFLGRVQDGQFIASTPRATYGAPTYQPPAQQYNAQGAAQPVNVQNLPNIPAGTDVPEYVMTSLNGGDIDPSLLADMESDIDTEVAADDFTDYPDLG
jgi:hypothetical protein